MMKNYLYILAFISTINFYAQSEKESIYLLFDYSNGEICQEAKETDKKVHRIKKYRKFKKSNGNIVFFICNERFTFIAKKNKKELCPITSINTFKDIQYMLKKHAGHKNFKHHLFKKIFIVEKVSLSNVIKYEVNWNDTKLGIIE